MPVSQITNIDRGPRGVHTVDGLVMLDPGATETLDIPEAELSDLPAYFRLAEPTLATLCDALVSGLDSLESMTVAQLRALAAERGVSLPETGSGDGGRVLKADLIAAFSAPPADQLDELSDEELRATVHALTGAEPDADADRTALLALARGA